MIANFLEGWKNLAWAKLNLASPDTESLAQERGMICLDCPYISQSNLTCTVCTCFIEAKIRSKSSFCPKGKW
jgi:hypothetical protein